MRRDDWWPSPPVSTNDGFGELISSTDALGRGMTLSYEAAEDSQGAEGGVRGV
ncbi:hypothetical protein [Sorangium sp. So ce887]|uniref:hypothetical protein n=1 Tax=Sorangium sp. So ce887 TaxID=3133324 RepID=UPI003F615CBE